MAFVLIFFSYYLHVWVSGAYILLCHDVSDIFLSLIRALEGQKLFESKAFKVFFYSISGFTVFIWGYNRTVIFPKCIFLSNYKFMTSEVFQTYPPFI